MGLVPQEFNFNFFESVHQIVCNQAGYYGITRAIANERAERYLTQLGLWDKRTKPARTLSGGMKRRLMIARALMNEPRLLILDEPTAGVDIELRRSMWQFMREINARGTFTLVYKGKDDYGITSVEGLVEKAEGNQGRSLVPAPQIALAIPGNEENSPETRSPVDLTNHPWAGARVKIKLRAKDEAGQEGLSGAIAFTLPQRPFTVPLAKALVEQRRRA